MCFFQIGVFSDNEFWLKPTGIRDKQHYVCNENTLHHILKVQLKHLSLNEMLILIKCTTTGLQFLRGGIRSPKPRAG